MIDCCRYCKPPKRTPTCHFDGTCQKYIDQKKKHEEERAAEAFRDGIDHGILAQRARSVTKAKRKNKTKH